jgi:hypothetical protein
MVWSATMIAAGVELNLAIADNVLRRGTIKFAQLRAPLDACLLLDLTVDSGVAPVDGAMMVTGDQ